MTRLSGATAFMTGARVIMLESARRR
jgi:hypothetical protein